MEADYRNKWQKCLEIIRDNIGQQRFDTWFGYAKDVDMVDDSLIISLPSMFFIEKYEDDFCEIISRALLRVFGRRITLKYQVNVVRDDKDSAVTMTSPFHASHTASKFTRQMESPVDPLRKIQQAEKFDSQLNNTLTFENYCVGEANRLPFTIAEFIAKNPKKVDFNPFFIYGEVGVGKTHLMQAIGNYIKETVPRAKVLFVPMRQFQYQLAKATQEKKIPQFIGWYEKIDALLIDDLQELSFKAGTNDALFPIFNTLHQHGKKLVFTCDRPPIELDGITDRLIDRFKWGVTEKLPKPDYNLRKAILEMKARKNGLAFSDRILDMIAEASTGSVRELEGIVMGLLTRSIALGGEITEKLVADVMKQNIKKPAKKSINFDMIVESAAEHYHLNPDVIFSKSRVREIADARQMIMFLAKKHTGLSLPAIGAKMNRKHSTVLHDIRCVQDRMSVSPEVESTIEAIENILKR